MIKQFSAGDITVRPFGTFKNWTLQSIDSSSVDKYGETTYYNGRVEINEGLKISGSFYPSGSEFYVAANDPINISGKYARNVYSMTDAMFYKNTHEAIKLFGVEHYTQDPVTGQREVRHIHDRIITATLKHNVFGDKVIPNTVQIIDNSSPHSTLEIYDDGYTNLYVTGSQFSTYEEIAAARDFGLATRYWETSSGQFYVHFNNGVTQSVNYTNAKEYMAMGLTVVYVAPEDGGWRWDASTHQDIFIPQNEHFGESVSTWANYTAVGSSMDVYSLSDKRIGYASVFKYDESSSMNRLVAKINFPFTQSASDTSSYFQDTFGYSVAINNGCLAVGSPSGSACSLYSYPGYVCVYHKDKGGSDNWGIINLIKGKSYDDRFGNSLSMDSDILAIGAPGVSGSKGAVYIYRKKRYMDTEFPCQSIPTGSVWEQVVTSVDFCAELITGSYIASQSNVPTFVSGNYFWAHEATLTSSVAAAGDNFGWSLSVDSNRLVVGTNKTSDGYATVFSCSYSSASISACPTASWHYNQTLRGNSLYGDLNMLSPEYSVDVSDEILSDKFGYSVAISGKNIVVGCKSDKAFKPHSAYTGSAMELGAAYFYHFGYEEECLAELFYLKTKSFGNREHLRNNNFGHAVAIDGVVAAVTSLPDTLARGVDYTSSAYILENYSYESTGSEDSVLGRVDMYNIDHTTNQWTLTGELRRNKESNHPYNIYGYSVDMSSEFMIVGAPVVNIASASHYSQIINETNQISSSLPSSYSGSAFLYDMTKYELDPKIGNVFYKNGYIALTNTSSNYGNVMTGTGSRGFELKYQGEHTIYEHEYLISIRPGEFNYSTNPSSLNDNPLTFDVNQDGVFDYKDVDLIMRYLRLKKFYAEYTFDDNGIILEQDTLSDYSWWANDILQTESEDVLQQEDDTAASVKYSYLSAFSITEYQYIEKNLIQTGILDIDGDGNINLNDGFILALYALSRLNPNSLSQYLNPNSTRKYVVDIQKYLDYYCGNNPFAVKSEFLTYQYSSSYDSTGSFLAPYVTTIGLYQDNQLVAVGKLGRPIKNLIDWPVNIVVRFDT